MTKLEVTWEALLDDGTTVCERDGVKYAGLPLARLVEFRVVRDDETLFSTRPPPGSTGTQLRYRWRTETTEGPSGVERRMLIGWEPFGPAYLLDIGDDEWSAELSAEGFNGNGWFEAPVPIGEEA